MSHCHRNFRLGQPIIRNVHSSVANSENPTCHEDRDIYKVKLTGFELPHCIPWTWLKISDEKKSNNKTDDADGNQPLHQQLARADAVLLHRVPARRRAGERAEGMGALAPGVREARAGQRHRALLVGHEARLEAIAATWGAAASALRWHPAWEVHTRAVELGAAAAAAAAAAWSRARPRPAARRAS